MIAVVVIVIVSFCLVLLKVFFLFLASLKGFFQDYCFIFATFLKQLEVCELSMPCFSTFDFL